MYNFPGIIFHFPKLHSYDFIEVLSFQKFSDLLSYKLYLSQPYLSHYKGATEIPHKDAKWSLRIPPCNKLNVPTSAHITETACNSVTGIYIIFSKVFSFYLTFSSFSELPVVTHPVPKLFSTPIKKLCQRSKFHNSLYFRYSHNDRKFDLDQHSTFQIGARYFHVRKSTRVQSIHPPTSPHPPGFIQHAD